MNRAFIIINLLIISMLLLTTSRAQEGSSDQVMFSETIDIPEMPVRIESLTVTKVNKSGVLSYNVEYTLTNSTDEKISEVGLEIYRVDINNWIPSSQLWNQSVNLESHSSKKFTHVHRDTDALERSFIVVINYASSSRAEWLVDSQKWLDVLLNYVKGKPYTLPALNYRISKTIQSDGETQETVPPNMLLNLTRN